MRIRQFFARVVPAAEAPVSELGLTQRFDASIQMSKSTHPVVYIDTARDRNKPIVGRQLAVRVFRRVFLVAPIVAAGVSLAWLGSAPLGRVMAIFLLALPGFSLVFLILLGSALLGDYRAKQGLAEKYGFDLRFGLDTRQHRTIRIESAPADLSGRIAQALQAIAEDAQITQTDPDRFEATLSRKGKRMRCRVTAHLGPGDGRGKKLTIESKLSEPLVFNDIGQNIINVEEFQRALIRLLAAEQRSLSEVPNAGLTEPELK